MQFKMNTNKLAVTEMLLQTSHIILVLLLIKLSSSAGYENTWNFYYEQPCCSNSNSHHLRHHKGKYLHYPTFDKHLSFETFHIQNFADSNEKHIYS